MRDIDTIDRLIEELIKGCQESTPGEVPCVMYTVHGHNVIVLNVHHLTVNQKS